MSVLKGQKLRVMQNGKCIAESKSCTIHIAVKTDDASTKDDADASGLDWDKVEVTGASWDVSVDSLISISDSGAVTTVDQLSLIGQELDLSFDVMSGTQNRTATSSTISKSGKAFISDLKLDAPNRANATNTIQFIGNGPLS